MAAYIPGAGIKKPLNMIEGPIYPDIKKGPPRFAWSGKHWVADAAVMRDTEQINQFYESAVLAQARDYNQTVYGQSSHRDVVNAAFRPPLIDPIEDIYPLTRIPATSKTIVPRINPGTADNSGTSGFAAKNERINNIEKHLTDRVTSGNWRATFYAPIEVPMDNSVLPDLELTLPAVSASAGFVYPAFDAPTPEVHLDHEQIHPLMDTGVTTQVHLDGSSGREGMELYHTRPQVSASAGMNTPIQINGPQDLETRLDLGYTRPQVSASAGVNTPVQLDGPTRTDIEFETRLEAPMTVVNPGLTEDGYKTRMDMDRSPEEYIQESHPRYSYVVPATSPAYRAQNEMTYRPQVHQPLQPLKHYGQISHSSAIPQMGVARPQVLIKDPTRTAGIPRKAVYRF